MTLETAVAEIKIGQPVAIRSSYSGWGTVQYNFLYKIYRITPSGQIAVRHTENSTIRRFDKNGDEIGSLGSKYNRDTIHLNVEELQRNVEKEKNLQEAAKAIAAVGVSMRDYSGWSFERLQEFVVELEMKLAVAKEKLALCASETQEQK